MKIVLATNNANKLREISQMLAPIGYEVISQKEAGVDIEIEETGTTFEENAVLKAEAVYKICHTPVIADDSGLEVDYLDGAPGVYSHRYAGENATDADRCEKILNELEGLSKEERTARFVCSICYINTDNEKTILRGECEGYIGFEARGENGFGYDPIFMYGEKSFAELDHSEKNKVSHRSNALKKLFDELSKN